MYPHTCPIKRKLNKISTPSNNKEQLEKSNYYPLYMNRSIPSGAVELGAADIMWHLVMSQGDTCRSMNVLDAGKV